MKSLKSKHIFMVSVICAAVLLMVCTVVAIKAFSGKNRIVPAQISPSPAPVVQASVDSAGETGQDRENLSAENHIQPSEGISQKAGVGTEPIEPGKAAEPGQQDELSPPGNPTQPSQPMEPSEPIQPADPVLPAEPTQSAEPGSDQGDNLAEMVTVESITREQAGLDTIPALNFDRFTLDKRIHELLLESRAYTDEDMIYGIEEPYLITERFQGAIIEDITIGTELSEVIRILGEPSFQVNSMTVYKTEDYYIGFYGTARVELANFVPNPKLQNEDILNTLLTALCVDQVYITEYLAISDTGFFDRSGHIHGGGHYAQSPYGVLVDTLSQEIEIHNNFEGILYQVKGDSELALGFINSDSNVDRLYSGFWNYLYLKDYFLENGKTSPSGKYTAIYEWITSDHHYFTIRTNDFSVPDYRIGASAGEFEWLNDDYIIYTAIFSNLPVVIRVTDDLERWENIRLIPEIDALEYDYASVDYRFNIDRITENAIILKDENAKGEDRVYWEFAYSFEENGKIHIVSPDGLILE